MLAPVLAPTTATAQSMVARNQPPGFLSATGIHHLLGTDHLGRDVLSRLLFGVRLSLAVGFAAMIMGGAVGVTMGLIAGYFGGKVDAVIMRLVDVQMSFPFILLAIVFAALWGGGFWQIIIIVSIRGWVDYARLIRGLVLSIKERSFINASRAVGSTTGRILAQHILPHILAPALVIGTFQVGSAIVLESTLSFLGLGIDPPTPSLGGILNDGRNYLSTAWWPVASSGAWLTIIVLAINLTGDGLRDILDPRFQ